jgi:hypothetical protein
MWDKILVSSLSLDMLHNKKVIRFFKWAKDLNRYFSKEDVYRSPVST